MASEDDDRMAGSLRVHISRRNELVVVLGAKGVAGLQEGDISILPGAL